ncbi:MAG: hypothetical protein HYY16_14880 [Planctomycetes bacterium]|nr:hypothetical protein [Planctomycetota bacterium]
MGTDEDDEGLTPLEKESVERLRKMPPIFVRASSDPYCRGPYLAYLVYERSGLEGFRALFREKLLTNTRDAMFPAQWMKSPRPVATVALGPVGEALGDGWEKPYEDTLGALAFHTLLEDYRREADAVGKAWDGDGVELWRKGDQLLIAVVVLLNTETEAAKLAKQLERLYREQWTKGAKIKEHEASFVWLSAGSDHFVAEARGKIVVLARGALPQDPSKLVAALGKGDVTWPEAVRKP